MKDSVRFTIAGCSAVAVAGLAWLLLDAFVFGYREEEELLWTTLFTGLGAFALVSTAIPHWARSASEVKVAYEGKREAAKHVFRESLVLAEKEVDGGEVDLGVWAEALVEVEGDESKRKAKYMELRAKQLSREHR